MKRLDRNIGATNRTLQKRPKVFYAVSVHRTVYVVLRMTNESMLESLGTKSVICAVFVRIDRRSRLNNFADDFAGFIFPRFRNHASPNLALAPFLVALQQTKHGG